MLANRVREYTATTGTGDITLAGAMAGYVGFADAFSSGDQLFYVIEDGENYEIGSGRMSGSDTLVRETISEKLENGELTKEGATALELSGSAIVFCTATAEYLDQLGQKTDTISEASEDAGVTVDGVLLKDGNITAGSATYSGDLSLGGSDLIDVRDIFRGSATSRLQVGGGVDDDDGATQVMYAGSHVGNAGDHYFKSNGTTWMHWDHSETLAKISGDYEVTGITTIGTLVGATLSGNLRVKTDIDGHAIHIEENAAGENWSVGVNNDGDLQFFNSGASSASVTFSDDDTVQFGGDITVQTTQNPRLYLNENLLGVAESIRTVGIIEAVGRSTLDVEHTFAEIAFDSTDATDGSEDAQVVIRGSSNGSLIDLMELSGEQAQSFVSLQSVSSGSEAQLVANNTGSGDPVVRFRIDGISHGVAGVDASDGNKFKFANSNIGTSPWLTFDPADGSAEFGGSVKLTTSSYYENSLGNRTFDVGTTSDHGLLKVYDSAETEFFRVDAYTSQVTVGGSLDISGDRIHRDVTDSNLFIAGGAALNDGGNIILYGSAHPTNAGDIQFRNGLNTVLFFDASEGQWELNGYNLEGVGDVIIEDGHTIRKGSTDDALFLSGGDGSASSTNIILYGSTNVNYANDMVFRSGGTVQRLRWDESASYWNFNSNTLTGVDQLLRGSSTDSMQISGGTSSVLGGSILLFSEDHATLASDITFRSSGTNRLTWDNSSTVWDFQGNDLSGVGDITMSGSLMLADGSESTPGLAFGSDTNSGIWSISDGHMGFSTNSSERFRIGFDTGIPNNNGMWITNGSSVSLVVGADSLGRSLTDANHKIGRIGVPHYTNAEEPFVWVQADSDASDNILYLGGGTTLGNAATSIRFYAATDTITPTGTLVSQYDAAGWGWYGNDFSGVGDITMSGNDIQRNVDTDRIIIGGGTAGSGADIIMYGGSNASYAGDFAIRVGSIAQLYFDASTNEFNFGSNALTGVGTVVTTGSIVRHNDTGGITISGGSGTGTGANLNLYAASHSTQANDIVFRSNGDAVLSWDESASYWNFQGNDLSGVGDITIAGDRILRSVDADDFTISGGSGAAVGSNLVLYGSSHATNANDFIFRSSGNAVLSWDDSESYWNFQAKNVRKIASIARGTDISFFTASGGTSESLGGNAVFYGENHPTYANDMYLRTGTTIRAMWDHSENYWNFNSNDITGVNSLSASEISAVSYEIGAAGVKLLSGSGSPESSVTAPVGSLYMRTDGTSGSVLYVKETGTGTTGWAAK